MSHRLASTLTKKSQDYTTGMAKSGSFTSKYPEKHEDSFFKAVGNSRTGNIMGTMEQSNHNLYTTLSESNRNREANPDPRATRHSLD